MRRPDLVVAFAWLTAAACGGATEKSGSSNDLPTAGTANDPPSRAGTANDLPGSAGSGIAGTDHGSAGLSGRGGASDGRAGAGGLGGDCSLCGDPAPTIVGEQGDHFVAWRDSWFLTGCKAVESGNCRTHAAQCPAGGSTTRETFPVNGTPGQRYKVTFTFSAVVETKEYTGGRRDAGSANPADAEPTPADTFYRDGHPSDSDYNTWRLTVFDDRGLIGRYYYLNSAPPGAGHESGRTYLVNFSKAIVIVGGGKLTHEIIDGDCLAVDNCGPGINAATCPAPRNLPGNLNLVLPETYEDAEDHKLKPLGALSVFNPNGGQPWHSQLGHLTVQSIEKTDDPLLMDYP